MRVISGMAKGRRLAAPKGLNTRPTSDRVKEAVFNVLGERVIDSNVLDLFAGTGSMGIEALSRGASHAAFVENSRVAWQVLQDNLEQTRLSGKASVYRQDVMIALTRLQALENKYDLIFVDPPYQRGWELPVLESLWQGLLVAPAGLVILESSSREEPPQAIGGLAALKCHIYGDTLITYYGYAITETS
ncbi:MAG: 16S rRNA (guanine(966)-N(2))-methyltransferase RsmD [Bacillota bacterium]